MTQNKSSHHRAVATWIFGFLFLVFLGAVFVVPLELTPQRGLILALFAGLLAGLFAFFLGGSLSVTVDGEKAPLGRVGVRAAGGFGMFVLVFGAFLWFLKIPDLPFGLTQEVTHDDLELLFARTFGVPDDYDFGSRPLSVAVERLQRDIDKRLDEYAQPKIRDHLSSVGERTADLPRTEEDEWLDALIREAEKEGTSHGITTGSDINVGGLWRTRPSHVGSGNLTIYRILQDQDGVRLTQDHPQIGRTLSGRGVITGHTVHVWYRTVTGATGKLELEIPDLIFRDDFDLKGHWDSGHGRRGRIILTRK